MNFAQWGFQRCKEQQHQHPEQSCIESQCESGVSVQHASDQKRIHHPADDRQEHQQISFVEPNRKNRFDVSIGEQDQHSEKGDGEASVIPAAESLFDQKSCRHTGQNGAQRIDDGGVRDFRIPEAQEKEVVITHDSEQSQQQGRGDVAAAKDQGATLIVQQETAQEKQGNHIAQQGGG